MSTAPDTTHGHGDPVRQEPDTTRLRFLLWSCVITAISTVASLYIALWLLHGAEGVIPPPAKVPPAVPGTYEAAGHPGIIERGLFKERTALKVDGEIQELKRTQEGELQHGWTDKTTGQVHPPISQAMDRVISEYSQRK